MTENERVTLPKLETHLWEAVNEVNRERAFSFLEDDQIDKVVAAYCGFTDVEHFAKVATIDEVMDHDGNLNISMYVRPESENTGVDKPLPVVIDEWQQSSADLRQSIDALFTILTDL